MYTGLKNFNKYIQVFCNFFFVISIAILAIMVTQHIYHDTATKLPRESFTLVSVDTFSSVLKCEGPAIKCEKITKDGDIRGAFKGSGLVIKHYNNESWILTAAHVCTPAGNETVTVEGVKLTLKPRYKIKLIDFYGNLHNATVAYADKANDMCLLKAPGEWGKIVKLSKTKPRYGEKVYNLAAPLSIFNPKMVLTFEGLYSGTDFGGNELFTFPARPGSSGSPIFNSRGELISMVHSAARRMENLALGCGYENLIAFITTYVR